MRGTGKLFRSFHNGSTQREHYLPVPATSICLSPQPVPATRTAVVENVGHWMPGDHPNSAAKFARHCGHLEAALYALGIPALRPVAPAVWMKTLGTLPKDKQERKRAIKERMARRHPNLTVTLATADALGILTAHLDAGKGETT